MHATARTYVRISWIRCSGNSFACAALGCDRAGDVNQECMGAVIGRSVLWKFCEAVAAEAVAAEAVAAALVRQAGFGVLLGMGGYTTTTVSRFIVWGESRGGSWSAC
jgi:hypothetical protein